MSRDVDFVGNLRRMRAEGMSNNEIKRHLRIGRNALYALLRLHGIPERPLNGVGHKPWTPEEVERGTEMRRQGEPWLKVALALGRSKASVQNRLASTEISRPRPLILPAGRPATLTHSLDFNCPMPAGHPVSCAAIGLTPWWPPRAADV